MAPERNMYLLSPIPHPAQPLAAPDLLSVSIGFPVLNTSYKCSLALYVFLCLAFVFLKVIHVVLGLPWWLSGKEFAGNAGDLGLIPESGRYPGEGNGNPL